MAALRIFVADDDEMVRRIITALLAFRPEWEICGETADAREAVEKVAQLRPDIVLLDIDMPNMNGLDATRQIVQNNPSQRVIALTTASTDQIVRDVFRAGALGFVLKANATYDLAGAIEAVQRGRTFFTAHFAEMLLKSYLEGDKETGSTEAKPSERERETVRLLTEELNMTLGHQWNKPRVARKTPKYLAIAVILLVTAGVWWYVLNGEPNHAPPTVDKLLVSLGLKAPPPAPAPPTYSGNPETKVWIDVHTALYYCPGADAFGKTPKGKIGRQREAQLDHFQPASGKVCD